MNVQWKLLLSFLVVCQATKKIFLSGFLYVYVFVKLHGNKQPKNHNFLSPFPSHIPFCLDWFCLVQFSLVWFVLVRFVPCCSMCLCHVVNETWKNDNKYYNQISTWEMTSSQELLYAVLPTIYLHRIIHFALVGDGPFPFHSICNYKANCFSIIISSFLRAHHSINYSESGFFESASKLNHHRVLPGSIKVIIASCSKQQTKNPIRVFFFLHINRHHSMIERLNVHFERSFPFNAFEMSFQFKYICAQFGSKPLQK